MKAKPIPADIGQYVSYDPETGLLWWLTGKRKGHVAGFIKQSGYVFIKFRKQTYQAHRVAFFLHEGYCPPILDHADSDRANNRWSNLRPATTAQNNYNRKKIVGDLPKGVWRTQQGRYAARIRCQRNTYYLGCFDTPDAAHEAYAIAARQHHGEFGRAA